MPNRKNQIVIAVDGSSASGKSTLSEVLAEDAGAVRLEYSLMFRAIAMHMNELGFNPATDCDISGNPSQQRINEAVAYARQITTMQWSEFKEKIQENPVLRSVETSRTAPYFSGQPDVLALTDDAFRNLINISPMPVVAEGRTIGRYVYPEADVKLFVDADLDVRAARRHASLKEKAEKNGKPFNETIDQVKSDLAKRDQQDQTRAIQPTGFSPALQYELDTSVRNPDGSYHSIEETLALAKDHIDQTLKAKGLGSLFQQVRSR